MSITHMNYSISKSSLSDEQELLDELTVQPIVHPNYVNDDVEPYPVYRQNSTKYFVPLHWGIKKYGPVDDQRTVGEPVQCEFNGALKPYQADYCQRLIQQLQQHTSCIACSPTGSGKTTMALWLIHKLGLKTLIIVHKEFLMDQWRERIGMFLPNCTIGTIRQSTVDTNHPITLGMIHSISMHEYPEQTFKSFDLCIIDEVHHVGSRMFSRIFYKVSSKYKLGLSATPKRKDGLTKVIEWFLGDILVNNLTTNFEQPLVRFVHATYTSKITPKYDYKGNLQTANLDTQLSQDLGRTEQILKLVKDLYNEGRKILVLSHRRAHCIYMRDALLPFTSSVGLYIGQMKEEELNKSNQCRIIVATYNMANEGYDNPTLDTLVLAMSKSDVEQSCGRILRQKNTHRPLIIDMIDSYLVRQSVVRRGFYKKKKFEYDQRHDQSTVVENEFI